MAVSQDDAEASATFSNDLGIAIQTLYDPEPWRASETLGLESVPTFFLVGPDRIVRDTIVGFPRGKMGELGGLAARLAGRPGAAVLAPAENVPAIKPG